MQRNPKTQAVKAFLAASAVFLATGVAFAQTTVPSTPPSTAPAPQGAPQDGMQRHHMGDHGRHHGGGMWLKSVDTDGDGTISKAEADALFNRIDTNHDGKLDKSELAAYHKAAWEKRKAEMQADFDAKFKAADKNGDGALTRDEMKAGFPRLANRFDQIDANHDGKVTKDEIRTAMQKMHRDHKPRRGSGASAPPAPAGSGG